MIPEFPRFSTVRSVAAAMCRLAVNDADSAAIKLLRSIEPSLDPIVAQFLKGARTEVELQNHHSTLPMRRRLRRLTGGEDVTFDLLKGNSLPRYCPDCACEDLDKFGCAHWRVAHTLPTVHHCWYHKTALVDRCGDCGANISFNDFRGLPLDPCQFCGGRNFIAMKREAPPLYWSYLRVCCEFLEGDLEDFPAERWPVLFGVWTERGSQQLVDQFLQGWGVSTAEELHSRIPVGLSTREFRILFTKRAVFARVNAALVLAILAFASDLWASGSTAAMLSMLNKRELPVVKRRLGVKLSDSSGVDHEAILDRLYRDGVPLQRFPVDSMKLVFERNPQWFTVKYPEMFDYSDVEEVRRKFRATVTRLKEHGRISNVSSLTIRIKWVSAWMQVNDADWLESEIGAVPKKSLRLTLEEHKAKVIQALAEYGGQRSRYELSQSSVAKSIQLIGKEDPEWLNETIPRHFPGAGKKWRRT